MEDVTSVNASSIKSFKVENKDNQLSLPQTCPDSSKSTESQQAELPSKCRLLGKKVEMENIVSLDYNRNVELPGRSLHASNESNKSQSDKKLKQVNIKKTESINKISTERGALCTSGRSYTTSTLDSVPRIQYLPLYGRGWIYGQSIFARIKQTNYYGSGNIATYLGAGCFMVVYDDGTIDYRIKRPDILISEKQDMGRRKSHNPQDELSDWTSYEIEIQTEMEILDNSQPMPLKISTGRGGDLIRKEEEKSWQTLECGVAYESDSTQISDSDSEGETDRNVTPWQQMTQSIGIGINLKPRLERALSNRRRSSTSSQSNIEKLELSLKPKTVSKIPENPPPKQFRQRLRDFLPNVLKRKSIMPISRANTEIKVLSSAHALKCVELQRNSISISSNVASKIYPKGRVVCFPKNAGVRLYGTIKKQLDNDIFEVVTEQDQSIKIQIFQASEIALLPIHSELEEQVNELKHMDTEFFVGSKVLLYLNAGYQFSGPGIITGCTKSQDSVSEAKYHVLLPTRIRLHNVPEGRMSILKDKSPEKVYITDKQYILCGEKQEKVHVGDQVYVKCNREADEANTEYFGNLSILDTSHYQTLKRTTSKRFVNGVGQPTQTEEKLGILNGVYSDNTAAVDFADGSTGYNISRLVISKRKRVNFYRRTSDLSALKSAILNSVAGVNNDMVEVGFQVYADHPTKSTVEPCIVIKKHPTSACDMRFRDGTIAFDVYPNQMILGQHPDPAILNQETPVTHFHSELQSSSVPITYPSNSMHQTSPLQSDKCPSQNYPEGNVDGVNLVHIKENKDGRKQSYNTGDYVLAWSWRFGRFCSAQVKAQNTMGSLMEKFQDKNYGTTNNSQCDPSLHIVFDYGEQYEDISIDYVLPIHAPDTFLRGMKHLTNYSIDTLGYEIQLPSFNKGDAVMARLFCSRKYFHGYIERVNEVDRTCVIQFDSSARDDNVKFTNMFTVDPRRIIKSKAGPKSNSSSSQRVHFQEENVGLDVLTARRRRDRASSVGSMLMSVAGSIFRARNEVARLERRGSAIITEWGKNHN